MERIYIRPLEKTDAQTSYKWRNDVDVWKHTGNRPDTYITPAIELEWINKALEHSDEKRFAICLKDNDKYIGNVQLTGINQYEAELHIFIGEKIFWKRGFGKEATSLIIDYAFNERKLQCVYLFVKKEHQAAIQLYKKVGFYVLVEDNEAIRMAYYALDKKPKTVSVFMMAYNHEKFIVEALDGILKQIRNFDIEIVIGEDFSTDNTRKLLLGYANKHPYLLKLILYEKNVGAHKNQIAVLNACTGKYIAMCEGDDYWTNPNKLQKQVIFLEANPDYAICFHAVDILENNELKPSELNSSDKEETYSIENLGEGNIMHTPSVVFRNGLIDNIPEWFNESAVGDYVLHCLNAKKGLIKYFPEVMAVYRKHNGGVWSSLDRVKILKNWLKLIDLLLIENFEEKVEQNFILQRRKYSEEILSILMKEETWEMFLEQLESLSKKDEIIAQKWLLEYYPRYIKTLDTKIEQLTNSRSFKLASSLQRVKSKIKW